MGAEAGGGGGGGTREEEGQGAPLHDGLALAAQAPRHHSTMLTCLHGWCSAVCECECRACQVCVCKRVWAWARLFSFLKNFQPVVPFLWCPPAAMKYVVITGGVVSGLGKGITISSVGVLLKAWGLRVTSIKIGGCVGA